MKIFLLLLFLAALVSSSTLPGFVREDENDVENAPVLHEDSPSTTTSSSSRSISALDAEGFFDEKPDTHSESDPAKAKVTIPIEIYKMCKAKKDCPGAWFCFNGRCVHPEIEAMRKNGGFRDHPLFDRARRLFY
ncbi:hypothetical protein P168DRAFT_289468 [Aspergillus campestris IBT 28561]|uniref:Uncharacterized protein n=1 Tax=Aspergillus campestris (strain IBT 28561) TaxID=1392248 RepID=A0A2I1D874_ASPC2|nr:uncharacterized protein P168DRAFT_289468 [Aspergillus campestris IBT 28561]PKY06082.1 hypothetical protein P168DRAFT_289468 [Aspergillus campestris IBT 28561]